MPFDPSDPATGKAGSIRTIETDDHDGVVDTLVVCFDSESEFANARTLVGKDPAGFWFCGSVVPDASRSVHFYFSPSTTFAAEFTAEAMQTSFDAIKLDPLKFVPGATPISRWCVTLKPAN